MQAAQAVFWRLKGWKRNRYELSWVVFVSVTDITAINNSADCPIYLFNPLKVFQLRKRVVVNQKKVKHEHVFGILNQSPSEVFQAWTTCLAVAFFPTPNKHIPFNVGAQCARQGRVWLCLSSCCIRWQEEGYCKLLVPFVRKVHFLFLSLVDPLGVTGKNLSHVFNSINTSRSSKFL